MDRKEFIDTLFDNGHGLTLDQIQAIEDEMPSFFPTDTPDEFIDDILNDPDVETQKEAMDIAMFQARDVFIDMVRDCADMLEIRDCFKSYFQVELTDIQVFRMSLL